MKNYCGIPEHEIGCACTKEGQLLADRMFKGEYGERAEGLAEILEDKTEENYTLRRKVIYKGVMAPKGQVFLVINGKLGKHKFEAKKRVLGGQGAEAEKEICDAMYEQIKKQYNESN